jgi:hypothetical protein
MDGEVIDALFGLFDQGVAEDFPGQVFGLAIDLFQRLVDRHGADRHRRVAHDPFARFVDVLAGRQVHHRVAAPADRPGHLVDFVLDGRGQRRVADVAVDLGQEVAADDHRLGFGVVDVVGDDGAAAGDFVAHELGRDHARDRGAETLPRMLGAQQFFEAVELLVLADRDVFHLGGDDALTGVVHLRHVPAGQRAARTAREVEAQAGQFGVRLAEAALAAVVGRQVGQFLGVIALGDPGGAQLRQALADVDAGGRVGIGAGAVIDRDRRIRRVGGRALGNLAHRHADVGPAAVHVNLA